MHNYKKNMKRSYLLFTTMLFLIFIIRLPAPAVEGGNDSGKFFAGIDMNLFYPSANSFKEIYTSSIVIPGFHLGYHLSKEFYLLTGVEFYSTSGKTPSWDWDTRLKQRIFSLGGGYSFHLSEKIRLSGDASILFLKYTEEIKDMELKHSNSSMGFRMDMGLWYQLSKLIRMRLNAGFDITQDTVDDTIIKFGGLQMGVGIFLVF